MGGTITLSGGHDALYYTSQMGGVERGSADYYLSATQKQGEPQGTWIGKGLADLGIHDGDKIDPKSFEQVYGAFINPETGETLGTAPRVNAELRKLFEEKKAAEPALTRERERELWIEARAECKSAGVMFWDSTFSVEKSISLAHATALASARQAREAGDLRNARSGRSAPKVSGPRSSRQSACGSITRSLRPGSCVLATMGAALKVSSRASLKTATSCRWRSSLSTPTAMVTSTCTCTCSGSTR